MRTLASLHPSGVALRQLRKTPSGSPDNEAESKDPSASAILGVGHFTVPPDVIAEGPADSSDSSSAIRTIVVPYGITAVPRRSPVKARKRTAWRSVPGAHDVVARAGRREWFADRLFVESKHSPSRAAYTTSMMVHAAIVICALLLAARATRIDLPPHNRMDVSLRMPAVLWMPPAVVVPQSARTPVKRPLPASRPARQAPPPALAGGIPPAVPLETPTSIGLEPATFDETATVAGGGGAEVGGVAGGSSGGSLVEPAPAPPKAMGPLRVGGGVAAPRKIKDVRPVYPQPAMNARVGGSVLIEATIGVDGKVHDARILRSVAYSLDQAALDAVRQWEYEPSRLNSVTVAVTMVIVVVFSLS